MRTRYTNFTIIIKGALKIACLFNDNVSASGDFVPQTLYWGSTPGPHWGTRVQYDFQTDLFPESAGLKPSPFKTAGTTTAPDDSFPLPPELEFDSPSDDLESDG